MKGYAKLLVLSFLLVGVFVTSTMIVAPQIPIVDTITIGPSSHSDYSRALPAGRTLNIEIKVLAGTPPSSGDTVLLSIMDPHNYNLKSSGAPTYSPLLQLGASSLTTYVWHTQFTGDYYFVLENLALTNTTVSIKILWELQWIPGVEAALVLAFALITLIAVGYDYFERLERLYAPPMLKFSGDLDVFAEGVVSAPQRLHAVTLAVPIGTKCAICGSVLEEYDPISFCPHCGSASHSDHFVELLRENGSCPVCGRLLNE